VSFHSATNRLGALDVSGLPQGARPPYLMQMPLVSTAGETAGALRMESTGGPWTGNIFIVPHLGLRRFMIAGFPILACVAIIAGGLLIRRGWLSILVLAATAFPLFYTHYFWAKFTPIGAFFGDGRELVEAVRLGVYAGDMQKHPCFLPLMRLLTGVCGLLFRAHLTAFAVAYGLVSAANAAVATMIIRRAFSSATVRALLPAAYVFSFSILTYSSVFETYILTSLLLNLAILAAMLASAAGTCPRMCVVVATLGLLPTATPQTFIFVPSFAGWVANKSGVRKVRVFASMAGIIAASLLLTALVNTAISRAYAAGPGKTAVSALVDSGKLYFKRHAVGFRTLARAARDVVIRSSVNARALPPTGTVDQPFPAGSASIAIELAAAIVILALLCAAFAGLVRTRPRIRLHHILMGLSLLGYLLFHALLSPAEILLFIPPVFLLLLIAVSRLAMPAIGVRRVVGLLSLLVVLQLAALCTTSYRASAALFASPGTVAPRVIQLESCY
jgi:hypothetical protein